MWRHKRDSLMKGSLSYSIFLNETDTPGKEWLADLELIDLDLLDLVVAMEMSYTRGDLGF